MVFKLIIYYKETIHIKFHQRTRLIGPSLRKYHTQSILTKVFSPWSQDSLLSWCWCETVYLEYCCPGFLLGLHYGSMADCPCADLRSSYMDQSPSPKPYCLSAVVSLYPKYYLLWPTLTINHIVNLSSMAHDTRKSKTLQSVIIFPQSSNHFH